jgi:AcrR family transcriptional regulator
LLVYTFQIYFPGMNVDKTKKAKKKASTAEGRKRNARGQGPQLREELIDAAIALLARLSPEEPFSLRAVAKETGVAAPSVYLQFADRNALFMAVLEKLFTEQISLRAIAEEKAAKAGGGAWEKLLARSLDMVKSAMEETGHYKVLFEGRVVARLDDPKAAAFGRPLLERSKELIAEIVKNNPAPRVSQDPERLALLLWGGTHGIISLIINKPTIDWPDAEELVKQMAEALLGMENK